MPGNIRFNREWQEIFLPTALVASAVLLALAGWWFGDDGDGAQVKYRLTKVERGTIVSTVAASGTLNAVKTIAVSSQISGQLEVLVDFNSNVNLGRYWRIDPRVTSCGSVRLCADLDAARSSAGAAEQMWPANVSSLARRRSLGRCRSRFAAAQRRIWSASGFISTSELDKAETTFRTATEQVALAEQSILHAGAQAASAQANVRQREVALQSAQVDLEKTTIRAPVDGVNHRARKGGSRGRRWRRVCRRRICSSSRRICAPCRSRPRLTRPTSDGSRWANAKASPGCLPAPWLQRQASPRSAKAAQVIQNVVTYVVTISADNPDLALVPGMTANTRITVDARDNIARVANAALRFAGGRRQQGRQPATRQKRRERRWHDARCWLPGDGKPQAVEICTGSSVMVPSELTRRCSEGRRRGDLGTQDTYSRAKVAGGRGCCGCRFRAPSACRAPGNRNRGLCKPHDGRGRGALHRDLTVTICTKVVRGVGQPSGSGKSTFMESGRLPGPLPAPGTTGWGNPSAREWTLTIWPLRNAWWLCLPEFQPVALTPECHRERRAAVDVRWGAAERAAQACTRGAGAGGARRRADHWPTQLSGGPAAVAWLLRAIDQPAAPDPRRRATGALDTRTSLEIMALFQSLQREGHSRGAGDHESDATFARGCCCFRDGRLVGDPLQTPRDAETAEIAAFDATVPDELFTTCA